MRNVFLLFLISSMAAALTLTTACGGDWERGERGGDGSSLGRTPTAGTPPGYGRSLGTATPSAGSVSGGSSDELRGSIDPGEASSPPVTGNNGVGNNGTGSTLRDACEFVVMCFGEGIVTVDECVVQVQQEGVPQQEIDCIGGLTDCDDFEACVEVSEPVDDVIEPTTGGGDSECDSACELIEDCTGLSQQECTTECELTSDRQIISCINEVGDCDALEICAD